MFSKRYENTSHLRCFNFNTYAVTLSNLQLCFECLSCTLPTLLFFILNASKLKENYKGRLAKYLEIIFLRLQPRTFKNQNG